MIRIITLSVALVLMAGLQNLKAQQSTFSLNMMESYVNAYTEPFAKAFPIGLGGGWTHTANVHSFLGFDVTMSASLVMIPSTASTVKTTDINLPDGFSFADASANVPTIRAKSDVAAPDINILLSAGGYEATVGFPAFKGVGLPLAPSAALQVGFGLPKGTEIMARFIPDLSGAANKVIPDGTNVEFEKTGMWGVGVKHDIKQWIPVVSKVPFLQISGMLTYSRFYTGFSGGDLMVTPEMLSITNGTLAANTTLWNDQKFKMKASSFTGSLLIGATIPVFQPFIGVGFNSGKFESGFYGTYPIVEINSTNGDLEINDSETDPLIIENKSTKANFMAGARLKLGPIVFHYALTMAEYKMHSAGLAVTLR